MSAAALLLAGLGIAVVAAVAGTMLATRSQPGRANPYDTARLRREMIASAASEEERCYLEELDALELHQRHLVC